TPRTVASSNNNSAKKEPSDSLSTQQALLNTPHNAHKKKRNVDSIIINNDNLSTANTSPIHVQSLNTGSPLP
ncbi:MAG: hypothetical protein PV344_01465, partial [Anaplasma sp.]|nr:hypothetical protein [Anaplasma sp.]